MKSEILSSAVLVTLVVASCSKVGSGQAPEDARTQAPTPIPQDQQPPTTAKEFPLPPPPALPVLAEHAIFIGAPKYVPALDCSNFDSPQAPHRRQPENFHDATDYPERYGVVLQKAPASGPMPEVSAIPRGSKYPSDETPIAFALGRDAFLNDQHRRLELTYDASYCKSLNALLANPFVVIHAFPIHVDHGNGEGPLGGDWGTNLRMRSRGFSDLASAQAYAKSLKDVQRGPSYQEPPLKETMQGSWRILEALGTRTTLAIHSTMEIEGDQLGGSTGCNQYSALITWNAKATSEFTLGPLTVTERGCSGETQQWEKALLIALQSSKRGWFEDGGLLLSHSDNPSLRARPVAP